jgi:hypothetical protein
MLAAGGDLARFFNIFMRFEISLAAEFEPHPSSEAF